MPRVYRNIGPQGRRLMASAEALISDPVCEWGGSGVARYVEQRGWLHAQQGETQPHRYVLLRGH